MAELWKATLMLATCDDAARQVLNQVLYVSGNLREQRYNLFVAFRRSSTTKKPDHTDKLQPPVQQF